MPLNGWMLGCLAALVGGLGVFIIIVGLLSLQQGKQTKTWKVIAGKIIQSTLEEKRQDIRQADGVTHSEMGYQPQVNYEYRLGDRVYTGHRINLVERQYTQAAGKKAVEKYPVGGTVQVHFDPNNPEESVLETGSGGSAIIFMLGGLVLIIAGIAIVIFG